MTVAIEQLYRLLRHFERGPADDPSCRLTKDGAALDVYLCSASKPTVAFGVRFHPDGREVQMGESITEDQVYEYTAAAVERVLADVKRIVTRPLDAYQLAAVASFVFNVGGGNLAKSTKLLPAIEAGRWEDAAGSMGEFIRAWGRREGHWHRMAEYGLLIRRYAEACTMLGLDFEPWCNTRKISLHERIEWQPDWKDPDGVRTGGRFFDVVLPTTTEFSVIQDMAEATPLPSLELVLDKPITSAPAVLPQAPAGKAEQPGVRPPNPEPPAVSATQSKPEATSIEGPIAKGPTPAVAPPQKQASVPVPAPKMEPPPKPPAPMPPSVQVNSQPDMGPTVRTMWVSKRFWGGILIIVGRLIIAADVTGNFAPGVRAFIGDGILMDWGTGVIVTVLGEVILNRGEKKAEGPMDTPRRIALMTPAP